MKSTSQKVHDFWFESTPATRLALLRIFIGGFALWYLLNEQDDFLKVAQTDPRLFAPVGVVFHGVIDLELFRWLFNATLVGAIAFTLGLWHRFVGPVFAGLLLWLMCYRNSWSMIYHSDNLVVLHMIVLGFTRAADALSLDSLFRDRRDLGTSAASPVGWQYGWPVKLICAVTVCSYFVTGVAKLYSELGLSWMTGENLRAQMAVDAIRKELLGGAPNPVAYALYAWVPLFTVLAVGTMVMEFCAPVAMLNRRLGYLWAVNVFLLHWGILVVMHITFHYQLSGVMFLPFFRLERLLEVPRWLRQRRTLADAAPPSPGSAPGLSAPAASPRALLYYDGECGLCDQFVQFVLRHDRAEYFQFATLQSAGGREQLARLGPDEADLRTVVLVEEGATHVRSSATLRVCRRLGGLWPLLYAFMLVPRSWRDGAYSLVARNRKRWFKPPIECPVMPASWRRRFIG